MKVYDNTLFGIDQRSKLKRENVCQRYWTFEGKDSFTGKLTISLKEIDDFVVVFSFFSA